MAVIVFPSLLAAAFNSAAINAGSSSSLSRSGGINNVKPLRRWKRSSRNFSWTTLSRSEQFVAQIMRALDLSIRSRANRSNSRSEEHTSELQSRFDLVCRLLLEKKKKKKTYYIQTY